MPKIIVTACFLAFFPVLAATSLSAAQDADQPVSTPVPTPDSGQDDRYRRAMQEARDELAAPEPPAARTSGWGASEILSITALALAVGVLFWLRRRLQRPNWTKGDGRTMRIVDRLPLGRQSTMFVVELENRRYWLADHAHGVTLLGECPPADAAGQTDKQDPRR